MIKNKKPVKCTYLKEKIKTGKFKSQFTKYIAQKMLMKDKRFSSLKNYRQDEDNSEAESLKTHVLRFTKYNTLKDEETDYDMLKTCLKIKSIPNDKRSSINISNNIEHMLGVEGNFNRSNDGSCSYTDKEKYAILYNLGCLYNKIKKPKTSL